MHNLTNALEYGKAVLYASVVGKLHGRVEVKETKTGYRLSYWVGTLRVRRLHFKTLEEMHQAVGSGKPGLKRFQEYAPHFSETVWVGHA